MLAAEVNHIKKVAAAAASDSTLEVESAEGRPLLYGAALNLNPN